MVFNWFRRQFNEQENKPEEASQVSEETPLEETPAEETPPPTATASPSTPAWMQSSGGLEKLKETAIDDTPEPEPESEVTERKTEEEEESAWSAQVLANQGRKPEDIS